MLYIQSNFQGVRTSIFWYIRSVRELRLHLVYPSIENSQKYNYWIQYARTVLLWSTHKSSHPFVATYTGQIQPEIYSYIHILSIQFLIYVEDSYGTFINTITISSCSSLHYHNRWFNTETCLKNLESKIYGCFMH